MKTYLDMTINCEHSIKIALFPDDMYDDYGMYESDDEDEEAETEKEGDNCRDAEGDDDDSGQGEN